MLLDGGCGEVSEEVTYPVHGASLPHPARVSVRPSGGDELEAAEPEDSAVAAEVADASVTCQLPYFCGIGVRFPGLGDRLGGRRGPDCIESLQPGSRLESFEWFASFDEERFGVGMTALAVEPIAVFELDEGEVEGKLERAQTGLGNREVPVGAGVVSGEVRTEAAGSRVEERRAQPRRDRLDLLDELERLLGPSECNR